MLFSSLLRRTIPARGPEGRDTTLYKRLDAWLAGGLLDRLHFDDFRHVVLQKVLNSHFQGGRRTRATRARALHLQVDHAVAEVVIDDVAAVLGHGRTDAGLEQILDLGNDLVVVGRGIAGGGRCLTRHDRLAGGVVLHDATQDRGLQDLPVLVVRLGDGDEVGAEEHPLDAFDGEQAFGERGRGRRVGAGEVHRALVHDHAAGEELQGRRVGGLLGLDKQTSLRGGPESVRPSKVPIRRRNLVQPDQGDSEVVLYRSYGNFYYFCFIRVD